MKVDVHPADEGGCGFYRLRWPAAALADQGANVTVSPPLDILRESNPVLGDFPVKVLVDADVIVLQRPMRRELIEAIPLLQRQGIAVVVELDDDFHRLPKGHPAAKLFAPRHNPERNWRWLKTACDLADLVTCTTPALASRYAPHGRFVVLPNCVPDWYLSTVAPRADGVTVTWTGTSVTHVGDLDVVEDAVARVQHDTGFHFRAVGSESTLKTLGVTGEAVPWASLTDRTPGGYAAAVAAADVGIVPLADNSFNRAKSALKMMEYASLGVVPVMTPTPDNIRMFQQGIGFLADTPADWYRHVRRLVADAGLRAEAAARGREVMRGWTYEGNAWRWLDAWSLALANRQGSAAA